MRSQPRRRTVSSPKGHKLLAVLYVALIVASVATARWVLRPDNAEVTHRLSELYGVEVVWHPHGKYRRDVILLDGRNVGEHCLVKGEWFGLDDVRIDCDDPAYQPAPVK
ncbi:hypothetical protein [Kribbella sp. NPDC048928]|uniref:hypothetical protein n=1 Tax=Kribbella sp. NPDC048928 TaxID=3364111 RepID=UPI003710CF7D